MVYAHSWAQLNSLYGPLREKTAGSCEDLENFVRGGPTLTTFFFLRFLVNERWVDQNTTLSGPSSARQRNAILMAFRWRADDGPTLNSGSVASSSGSGLGLLRNPIFL